MWDITCGISHGAIDKNSNAKGWFMSAVLQVIEIIMIEK